MHESTFSYPITKAYPFKWFTPVVIIGGIIVMVLLSVLNVASTGYTLISEYSTNPNSTVQQGGWFDKWPTLRSRIRPSCSPSPIPLNTQMFTNNTALQYTLNAVRPVDSPNVVSLPSLVYMNNPLRNCELDSLQMNFDMLERTANQMAMIKWGLDMQGKVLCQMNGPNGVMSITLIADYNMVPRTVSTYTGLYEFPGRNATDAASLWWGESLITFNYLYLLQVFQQAIGDQQKMSLYITRNKTIPADYAEQEYFSVVERDATIYVNPDGTNVKPDDDNDFEKHNWISRFSMPDIPNGLPGLIYKVGWIRDLSDTKKALPLPYLIEQTSGPNIWPIVDALAKSFESTILTDLGQTGARPNILNNETLLQNYTAEIPTIISADEGTFKAAKPGKSDYASLKNETGPLVVNPSVLTTVYLCQTPKRKPTGDLILSVLVADLVFFQAIWLLFTLCVGQYMKRNDPSMNQCPTCAAKELGQQVAGEEARYSKLSNVDVTRSSSQDGV